MTKFKSIISLVIVFVALVTGVVFVIANDMPVQLDLIIPVILEIPLGVAVLLGFLVGFLVGLLVLFGPYLATSAERRRIRKNNQKLLAEIDSLKEMALEESR